MPKSNHLTVSSLLIYIAATAPGLALTRILPTYLGVNISTSINNQYHGGSSGGWSLQSPGMLFRVTGLPLEWRPSYWLGHIPYWAGPSLLAWTIAATIIEWRRRDAVPRTSSCRPAAIVALAVALAATAQACRCLQLLAADWSSMTSIYYVLSAYGSYFWIFLPRLAGYSVAVAWTVLAVGGRRVEEEGGRWTIGRVLGWVWIAMAASSEVGTWLFALKY